LKTLKFTDCAFPSKLRGLLLIYDVAIVGAGPAGSSAAYSLENAGYNIILIDKEEFPRPKPCAGVLPPRIFSELEVPKEIVERPLDGYRIFSPSGLNMESSFSNPGIIVRREKFDDFLVKRFNSNLERLRISSYEVKKDFIKVGGEEGSYKSKIVIAADGANSIFRKIALKDSGMNQSDFAMAMQYEISLSHENIAERIGNWFEVFYSLSYGYGWISPLKDAVKVGVGGISDEFKKNTKKILDDFLENDEIKKKIEGGKIIKTEGHRIPMKGPYLTLTADRLLFCGDAGGFVFPGTGEGIYYAIKSGRVAAEAIINVFENQKFDSKFLQTKYTEKLEKNGLTSLRDVDFVERVLSSSEKAEKYVSRLKKLKERAF
jgi:geranylgeranyl reductase family protein